MVQPTNKPVPLEEDRRRFAVALAREGTRLEEDSSASYPVARALTAEELVADAAIIEAFLADGTTTDGL